MSRSRNSVTITSGNSTGSERVRIRDSGSTSSSLHSPVSVESGRSLSSSADSLEDDGIGPSDSASRPRYSSRDRVESRPQSSRRTSSARVPTIYEGDRERDRSSRRPRRVHSDRRDREHRPHREHSDHEEYHSRQYIREHRVPSDGSTGSVASYSPGSGSAHPEHYELPYRAHHGAPWPHAPHPSSYAEYPPSMMTSHPGHDPRALMSVPHHDPFPFYAAQAANPFSPSAASAANNPFSPMQTSANSSYFAMDPHAPPAPSPHPHMRPPGAPRPQSLAATTPMSFPDNAMSPYYPPGFGGIPPGMYPGGPQVHPHYAYMYHAQHTPPPPPEKSATPAAAAAPVDKVDDAARIFAMFQELEEKKAAIARKEAEEKERKAEKEAAEKAMKDTESSKIEAMLKKFEEERLLREQEKLAKAEAEAAAKAAAAAREAAISDAAKKAKEEAEKQAAEAAKKATEEHEKKLAEIKKAAEEHEKKKKELEDELAKSKGDPDSAKPPIKFKDAMNRDFQFPWALAKTWKGMEGLIKQAFFHVDTVGPHVMEGHYDLIGPNNEIILPQVWEIVAEAGWEITMELWPIPEPELIAISPPGAFPVQPAKRPKTSRKEMKPKSRHVEPSPAAMHAMPPPIPSHHHAPPVAKLDPNEIIEVYDEAPSKSSSNKSKKKTVRTSGFGGWMLGGAMSRSGKGNKEPEFRNIHLVRTRSVSPEALRVLAKHDPDTAHQSMRRGSVVRHGELPQAGCTVM